MGFDSLIWPRTVCTGVWPNGRSWALSLEGRAKQQAVAAGARPQSSKILGAGPRADDDGGAPAPSGRGRARAAFSAGRG